tara:strand:+ start:169 stop:894 length:726 start_codon:yes stop_codon:yes gene_type:complete
MLVSHRKKFIVTKGKKTAGTSVESFFERYCVPEGTWEASHRREESVTESGIIGYRGPNAKSSTWRNHMSAKEIRDQIGREIWDDYYKFTVIRNPFDKLVSLFYWLEKRKQNGYSISRKGRSLITRLTGIGNAFDRVSGNTDIEKFRSWIRLGGTVNDQGTYLIDQQECLDYYIRFEDLDGGIRDVCRHLSIEFDSGDLPKFKTGLRKNDRSIREFYDSETEDLVRKMFGWELDQFGYEMPD